MVLPNIEMNPPTYNRILLSHKNKNNEIMPFVASNKDGPRDFHTK